MLLNFIQDGKILNQIINKKLGNEDGIYKTLSRKGIFPYKFINSIKKLKYLRKKIWLKLKKDFYTSLNDENVETKDYLYYKLVWIQLTEKALDKYSYIYNVQDVLLLNWHTWKFQKLWAIINSL